MLIHVLSCRDVLDMASNGVAVELENLIVELTDATLLAPVSDGAGGKAALPDGMQPVGSPQERVLIVVALFTELAAYVKSIPRWRDQFASVVAYIIDPWQACHGWPSDVPTNFDCYFVPDEKTAALFRDVHGIPAHAIPLAADVLTYGCNRINRPLDVVAYGRQDPLALAVLKEAFNHPSSDRFLYHTTAWGRIRFEDNRRLIWKLLHKSRVSLCFDVYTAPHAGRTYPYSIIPIRYYEAIAAGAAIVGCHPDSADMHSQFDWGDALLGLPRNSGEILEWCVQLLDDHARLNAIHRRNHAEAVRRHDWRYRIRDLFAYMSWGLPERLASDLARLETLV